MNKIDNLLDISNFMDDKVTNMEKNENEFLFFIGGIVNEKMIHVSSSGERDTIATALYNVSLQNEAIKEILVKAVSLMEL